MTQGVLGRVLVVAGSDSGGGAGIQADLKTVMALGGYAQTAITAVTAQDTLGVRAVELVSPSLVAAQIDAALGDIGADAVKIGMLGSAAIARAVADRLAAARLPIVFDPVMVATSGAALADRETVAAFDRLMAMARLVTPNLPELAALAGGPVADGDAIVAAARALAARTGTAVLAKGGHGEGETIVDRLVGPDGEVVAWAAPRIAARHTHGTGCTLASAIACGLAAGMPLRQAIARGRDYVRAAIAGAPGLGAGAGPLGHGVDPISG